MKNLFRLLMCFIMVLIVAACSGSFTTEIPTLTSTLSPTATVIPSQTPTPTKTPFPTKTPRPEFQPEHFSFPIAFEGQYAIGHSISYAPCYHWNPNENLTGMTKNNWYNYFHAGDMYQLTKNLSKPEKITVLSPVNGIIESYRKLSDQDADGVTILTPYTYNGKPVRVSVFHITRLFDVLEVGSKVTQNMPLAIQETIFTWGNPEQALDIEINIDKGGNYPLESDFNPNAFIAAYDYLADDLKTLVPAGNVIINDTDRDHCNKSGHIP